MNEIWKDIIGYEGLYRISSFGRIKSCHINKKGIGWQLLDCSIDLKGYKRINLYRDSTRVNWKVHRLVAIHFIENPEAKKEVNHKDGIKINNRVENLEWCSTLENMRHAFSNSLVPFRIGETNGRAKLKEADVFQIRKLAKSGVDYKLIAKSYPVNAATINKIINKKLWSHV